MTRFGITRGFSAPVLALVATLAITGCSDDADVADAPGPRLVTTVGNYNVVKFNRNVYGVPHGVAIDWKKDDLAKVPGIIIDTSVEKVELAVKGLPGKDSSAASPVAPQASLAKTVDRYNIVNYSGKFYGVPHGVALDWKKDDLAKVPGKVIDTSVEKVEQTIRSLPGKDEKSAALPGTAASEASLVTTIGRYNIVKYNDNVYGVPQGVAVDWQKDDLSKVDGIVSGSSVTLVKISVIGRVIGDKVSRLTGGK